MGHCGGQRSVAYSIHGRPPDSEGGISQSFAKLLADALADSRWDMPYLGMQVLIEGLALAAFGVQRDLSNNPLVTQLLAYVMQDEAKGTSPSAWWRCGTTTRS